MKKLLFAAIAVFTFGSANAQDMSFGAKAGLNVASVSGDDTDGQKSLLGAHFGVFAEFKVSDKFSFQPELLYSMQGAKAESAETETFGGQTYSYSKEIKLKLSYLNIPLMAKYYVTEKFSLETGPQIGFLLKAENESESTVTTPGGSVSNSETTDGKDFTKGVDFGLNFGLGYNFTENVSAGVRYNLGLSDINDIEGYTGKNQNSVFQVSLGYKFN